MTRLTIACACLMLLASCATTKPDGRYCMTPKFGTTVCMSLRQGQCTWMSCDSGACLTHGSYTCEGELSELWHPEPDGRPVIGKMPPGCMWSFDRPPVVYFDWKTCTPTED